MAFAELLQWQWSDYPEKHRNHTNLLIHIAAVPMFVLAAPTLVVALIRFEIWTAVLAAAAIGLSLFLQGRGHGLEKSAPTPFGGGGDFARRVLAEQFITFPRFVVTGGWARNLRSLP